MTQREKTLATGLVAIVGLFCGVGALYLFAYQPLMDASTRENAAETNLKAEQDKLATELAQIAAYQKVDPRLKQWKKLSLQPPPKPPAGQKMTDEMKMGHVRNVQVSYEKYLSDLLQNNQFKGISVQVAQAEKQSVAKGKQPTYERVAFRVSGRGELSSVTGFMKEFYEAPLLHQLRHLTVEQVGGKAGSKAVEGELEMKATIDALLVTQATPRETALPVLSDLEKQQVRVLPDPPRNYYALAARSAFNDVKPPPRGKTAEDEEREKREREKNKKEEQPRERLEEVLPFVKVTMLCYDSAIGGWYATVYDQAKGGGELKLSAALPADHQWDVKGAEPPTDWLVVKDRYGSLSVDATVVYVDGKQLVFRLNRADRKAFYRLQLGDVFYPTFPWRPMSPDAVKALGVWGK
jgi:hypothetical protein